MKVFRWNIRMSVDEAVESVSTHRADRETAAGRRVCLSY